MNSYLSWFVDAINSNFGTRFWLKQDKKGYYYLIDRSYADSCVCCNTNNADTMDSILEVVSFALRAKEDAYERDV